MDDDKTDARIYGGADPENRTPPPPEGIRGEGADQDVMATRRAMVAGGETVEIQDTSGIAVAEAGGHSGLKRDTDGDR